MKESEEEKEGGSEKERKGEKGGRGGGGGGRERARARACARSPSLSSSLSLSPSISLSLPLSLSLFRGVVQLAVVLARLYRFGAVDAGDRDDSRAAVGGAIPLAATIAVMAATAVQHTPAQYHGAGGLGWHWRGAGTR